MTLDPAPLGSPPPRLREFSTKRKNSLQSAFSLVFAPLDSESYSLQSESKQKEHNGDATQDRRFGVEPDSDYES